MEINWLRGFAFIFNERPLFGSRIKHSEVVEAALKVTKASKQVKLSSKRCHTKVGPCQRRIFGLCLPSSKFMLVPSQHRLVVRGWVACRVGLLSWAGERASMT